MYNDLVDCMLNADLASSEGEVHMSEGVQLYCSASEGWLQVDLIYSGAVVVPTNQNMHGTPDQLKVSCCLVSTPCCQSAIGMIQPAVQILNHGRQKATCVVHR